MTRCAPFRESPHHLNLLRRLRASQFDSRTNSKGLPGVLTVKRLTLILPTILCFLLIASTDRPVSAKDTWTSLRSKNFLLIGNASEKEIRQVGIRLEQF